MSEQQRKSQIRPASHGDIEQVVALDERITGIAKRDYLEDLYERYHARHPEQRFFFVAEREGRIVGFVVGEIRAWEFGSEPCGWVIAISVDPDLREDNVGSELLDRICDSFRQAGATRMRTMISRDNHLLMSFFRSRGLMAGPYLQLEKDLT